MSSNKKTPAVLRKNERKQRGRIDRSVMFPVTPPKAELPIDYADWLSELKQRIQTERLRVLSLKNRKHRAGEAKSLIAYLLTYANNSLK